MEHPRIAIHCKDCGERLVEVEYTPESTILSNDFIVEGPDPARRAAGVLIAVCPQCGGKTEFPAKYLPQ